MTRANEPDLTDVIEGAIDDLFYKFNCHRIGKIESFDPQEQTATISLVDKGVISGQLVTYSPLIECPIVTITGQKGGVTYPINTGDSCLVFFNDRDMDNWLVNGLAPQQPNTQRAHDFADAIALVGVRNQINKITNYNNSATELYYEANKVVVDANQVALKKDSGAEVIAKQKLTLQNQARNLKDIMDEFIQIVTNLKAVDNPAAPTITLVVDTATTTALTALTTKVDELLE